MLFYVHEATAIVIILILQLAKLLSKVLLHASEFGLCVASWLAL